MLLKCTHEKKLTVGLATTRFFSLRAFQKPSPTEAHLSQLLTSEGYRTSETKKLIGNIESGKHTFLVAPRRYGKSSLCEHAFSKTHYPWSKVDFYMAVTDRDVERILMAGIIELIGKSIGSVEKLGHVLKKYAKRLRPKVTVGTDPVKLELSLAEDSSPAENIAEALMILEKLLKEKDKQAVLLLDEFQEVGEMANGRGMEGAIRHVAQETQHLSIVFCGSNPHLLTAMFEDERRPLYKLCRKIRLDRIEAMHYYDHINKAAQAIWGVVLHDAVFERIMQLTERHPYYVNYLCDELCSECEKVPTVADVDAAWQSVVEEEKSDLVKDFATLSDNQRKLMIHVANSGGAELHGAEAAKRMGVTSNSISRALATLVEKDYLEKVGNHFRLIVPAYQQILVERKQR